MTNIYYDEYFSKKQEVFSIFYEKIQLPKDDPIHILKKTLEELDFSKLLEQYSVLGRKATNPIMLFALITYANMRGIRSVKKIIKACKRDICFMDICQNTVPSKDSIYRFKNERITLEILDDLHYQFILKLKEKGYVDLERLFVDGTKIEANANRYTFVWRGSVNYHLSNLIKNINELYIDYNNFINNYGYTEDYGLDKMELLVIDGIDKVREIIENNKFRKKMGMNKLSNNQIIKINNMDIESLNSIKQNLYNIAENENIELLIEKGKKKSELKNLYDDAKRYAERLIKYQEYYEIIGENRNSFSKTDKDATFMRMKDDHMKNGQLKPGYNVQFGTENHFIIDSLLTDDRTDYNTLIPIVEKHISNTGVALKEFIADSGYCSERGLKFLNDNKIEPYIKLQEHEIRKTRKYKNNIGKHYNMKEIDKNTYECANGRKLNHVNTSNSYTQGFVQEYKVYECENCKDCSLKNKCFYNYKEEKHSERNKVLKINQNWEKLKKISDANIQSEKGIIYRQIRSIQTEGVFGHMKENDDFRRFNNRSNEKAYKELMFYVFGYNINKLYRYIFENLRPLEESLTA